MVYIWIITCSALTWELFNTARILFGPFIVSREIDVSGSVQALFLTAEVMYWNRWQEVRLLVMVLLGFVMRHAGFISEVLNVLISSYLRRKKKAVHKTTTTDDKRLQNTLKRLGVNTIPGIEEVNIFKDETVIHFVNPKGNARYFLDP